MRPYSDCPKFLREFLIHIDTIKGTSKNTTDAYHSDLRTFFRFLKVYFSMIPEPKGFYSNNPDEAIESLRNIKICDISLDILKDIDIQDLHEYMAYLKRARYNTAKSRSRKISSLRSFFQYMHNAKYIEENPAARLELPKVEKKLPKYLELTESKALLSAVDGPNAERDYLILTLFLNCGMRLSELVGINISSIRNNSLTVTGKGNKQRKIYLNNSCVSALDKYLEVRPHDGVKDQDALFLNKNKTRLGQRGVQNIVKKYMDLAGIDTTQYSTHKLRHTAATLMYKYGNVDIRILQEILGHATLSTTEIYTHLDDERLRSAVERNPLSDEKKGD
ncbi:MAG: tyrosine recombinase XerC [Eubacteriales bacterium]|nr:tyrosine recombinase XerC [Eubacteriales bacterium]